MSGQCVGVHGNPGAPRAVPPVRALHRTLTAVPTWTGACGQTPVGKDQR